MNEAIDRKANFAYVISAILVSIILASAIFIVSHYKEQLSPIETKYEDKLDKIESLCTEFEGIINLNKQKIGLNPKIISSPPTKAVNKQNNIGIVNKKLP